MLCTSLFFALQGISFGSQKNVHRDTLIIYNNLIYLRSTDFLLDFGPLDLFVIKSTNKNPPKSAQKPTSCCANPMQCRQAWVISKGETPRKMRLHQLQSWDVDVVWCGYDLENMFPPRVFPFLGHVETKPHGRRTTTSQQIPRNHTIHIRVSLWLKVMRPYQVYAKGRSQLLISSLPGGSCHVWICIRSNNTKLR